MVQSQESLKNRSHEKTKHVGKSSPRHGTVLKIPPNTKIARKFREISPFLPPNPLKQKQQQLSQSSLKNLEVSSER